MAENQYSFDIPKHHKSIIKVMGVGGGGSNAVTHMYQQGIKDVEFIICNTDVQALKSSPVPSKLQIGADLTDGLGVGANPEKGRQAAVESREQIREMLCQDTRMLFITAGMGGGTGTGAAPVISEVAKELDILTVGIVTAPFGFEGKKKRLVADKGIAEMKNYCDTVLVILNDKLREMYGNLGIREAFGQADNVLTTAAKSIAEIITVTNDVNVDFEDINTVMRNSGPAVMGSAVTEGDNRARRAAEEALSSPLLNNTQILGAQKILLSISFGEEGELSMDELTDITDYIEEKAGDEAEVIFGQGVDPTLADALRVTVIATGFQESEDSLGKRKVYHLDSDRQINRESGYKKAQSGKKSGGSWKKGDDGASKKEGVGEQGKIYFDLEGNEASSASSQSESGQKEENNYADSGAEINEKREALKKQARERVYKLNEMLGYEDMSQEDVKERLEVPAYVRKKVDLQDVPYSSDKNVSRFNLNSDNDILGDNKFLHDNVD